MSRRGFLGGLLAAPAIVRAESLMKIWVPPKEVLVPQDPRRYLAKNRNFAHNYGVQGEISRILFPACVVQMCEEAFVRALEVPPGFSKLLTIEHE